jgi:DNA-binding GntR family transcriptional regulator
MRIVDTFVYARMDTSVRGTMSLPAQDRRTELGSSDRVRLTFEAYTHLKSAITAGELPPGERLYETTLAKRLKMSRTPVREALQRLINEGLAEVRPDGVYVGVLSAADVSSLEQANRALQCLAAELAARAASESDFENIEALMGRMESCAAGKDIPGWIAADQDIHRQLFWMSGNRWVCKLLLQMEALISRVRHLALRRPGRMDESTRQHRAIVDAIKARDSEAARKAMHDHLLLTEQHLVEILEWLEPFKRKRL